MVGPDVRVGFRRRCEVKGGAAGCMVPCASAAEAESFFLQPLIGTSELMPFPSLLFVSFAKTRHDPAREGHDFQSCR